MGGESGLGPLLEGWVAYFETHIYCRSPSIADLPFFGEGSPTKIEYRKKGTLILTSLLEDLAYSLQT